MRKTRFIGFGLLAIASAGAWACGSDGDDAAAPPTSSAGASGSAGATAGSSGTAGGGTSGNGGSSGATAGAAGEAGAGPDLAPLCAGMCADQSTLPCSFGGQCAEDCAGTGSVTVALAEYAAMLECLTSSLTESDYECSTMTGNVIWPAPKAGTSCEPQICAWTCKEILMGIGLADENVYARCNCQ